MFGGGEKITDAVTAADAAYDRSQAMATGGQHRAAIANIKTAVRLYRQLATDQPDIFRPDLARALAMYSRLLAGADHALGGSHYAQEALSTAVESEQLFRALAGADHPDAALFRPYLADALAELAARYQEGGASDEALGAAQEAIRGYDGLDADDVRRHATGISTAHAVEDALVPRDPTAG